MTNHWQPFMSQTLLQEFFQLIESKHNMKISHKEKQKIEQQLIPIVNTYGFKSVHDCLHYLIQAPLTKEQLLYITNEVKLPEGDLSDYTVTHATCDVKAVSEKLSSMNEHERYHSMDEIILLCQNYIESGAYQDAMKWCDEGLHLDRLNPRLHKLRAHILTKQGDVKNAEISMRGACYLDT